ncbi:hypothetical protein M433DRAFT_157740 [Acidomyces richmondensis BFW]|nr:hypothetical protein M433DRAFT_161440 [Acidomyces richmondensis BFW]KYG39777.1 hypothetical protein M433DRAFT_161303 [Acidomyces richmondensis BFW]KYG40019.1 hypothetical protein M433DRAFT_161014 [Acidomyces richmondensis BFW]KYG40310.1 hypothetical protein M433DRAFT_160608 [Acidomyces richmondensis BFW]KYG42561.1 hypothetical protein M433DRAFT_157740 [Acidomyces richmondensis BFW]
MLTTKTRRRVQRNRHRKMQQQHIPNLEIAEEIEEGIYKLASSLKIHYITATLRKSRF